MLTAMAMKISDKIEPLANVAVLHYSCALRSIPGAREIFGTSTLSNGRSSLSHLTVNSAQMESFARSLFK